jgi:hypothetical protein
MNQQSGQQDAVGQNLGGGTDGEAGTGRSGSTLAGGTESGSSVSGGAVSGSASAASTESTSTGSTSTESTSTGSTSTEPVKPNAGDGTPGTSDAGTIRPSGPSTAGAAAGTATTFGKKNEAVAGPFTVRDITVFASTLILFVASLIPMFQSRYNLWNMGSLFFLGLGIVLPLIVVALFVARRLTPDSAVRIGSLSVDQFASVVASFALAFFFLSAADAFVPSLLVALIGSLGLFASTVLARFIPFFAGDFLDRPEVPAHVVARESAAPIRKPRAPKAPREAKEPSSVKLPGWASRVAGGKIAARPAGTERSAAAAPTTDRTQAAAVVSPPAEPTQASPVVPASAAEETQVSPLPTSRSSAAESATTSHTAATPATAVNPQVRYQEPFAATVDPAQRPHEEEEEGQPEHEAFWFAVAQPRTAYDERTGAPAFVVEPGGWVLALEDRGDEFLVQHSDGRLGVLRDLSNIERG